MKPEQLELILSKSKQMIAVQDFPFVLDFIVLKYLNDLYEVERKEIRQDFLLRGICEREVDGLIEEPAYYKTCFIPKISRWKNLSAEFWHQSYVNLLKLNNLPSKLKSVDAVTFNQIYSLLGMFDFGLCTDEQKKDNIQIITQWTIDNNVESDLLSLLKS